MRLREKGGLRLRGGVVGHSGEARKVDVQQVEARKTDLRSDVFCRSGG